MTLTMLSHHVDKSSSARTPRAAFCIFSSRFYCWKLVNQYCEDGHENGGRAALHKQHLGLRSSRTVCFPSCRVDCAKTFSCCSRAVVRTTWETVRTRPALLSAWETANGGGTSPSTRCSRTTEVEIAATGRNVAGHICPAVRCLAAPCARFPARGADVAGRAELCLDTPVPAERK